MFGKGNRAVPRMDHPSLSSMITDLTFDSLAGKVGIRILERKAACERSNISMRSEKGLLYPKDVQGGFYLPSSSSSSSSSSQSHVRPSHAAMQKMD